MEHPSRLRSVTRWVALFAVAAIFASSVARADDYGAFPSPSRQLREPSTLDLRLLGEYRALHTAVIAPKRTRGKALLGVGIALGAVGFVMLIAGGILAVQPETPETEPYRNRGFLLVGVGAGLLAIGGGSIPAGAAALSEANSHDRALGTMVSFAR